MRSEEIVQRAGSLPAVTRIGESVSRILHEAVLKGGKPTRLAADLLHGKWLGHPLHPVLTDITVGAWSLGTIFDLLSLVNRDPGTRDIADSMIKVGTLSAIPTALTGLTDYSTVQQPALPAATIHALANKINILLYTLSIVERKRGKRGRGILLSTTAFGLAAFSAWLGGHLVYVNRVGVDNSQQAEGPEKWTTVAGEKDLADGGVMAVEVEGDKILLYREGKNIYALDAVCSHAGGPLEEGRIEDGCVQCPWHDSVFNLRTGEVVHGPATNNQHVLAARTKKGQIEIRKMEPAVTKTPS